MSTGAVTVTVELIPLVAGDFLFNPTVSSVADDPTPADDTAVRPVHGPAAARRDPADGVRARGGALQQGRGTPITSGSARRSTPRWPPIRSPTRSCWPVGTRGSTPGTTRRCRSPRPPTTRPRTASPSPPGRSFRLAMKYQLSISRVKDVSGNLLAGGVERFLIGKTPVRRAGRLEPRPGAPPILASSRRRPTRASSDRRAAAASPREGRAGKR